MLDEECLVPNGSDQGFVNKLKKMHGAGKNRRFEEIRTKQDWFVVKHFAGPVGYASEAFLDKNKDQLSVDVVNLFTASTNICSNDFIASLFQKDPKFIAAQEAEKDAGAGGPRRGKKKMITVSSEFREQLDYLMTSIDKTEPHFIRCIKPNPQNLADTYDRPSVTEQLRYGGVLQVVQVSRAGYPVRLPPEEVWLDYKILLPAHLYEELKVISSVTEKVKKLLTHLTLELNIKNKNSTGPVWAVGKTLVFFKQVTHEKLKYKQLTIRGAASTKIQAKYRQVLAQKNYELVKYCVQHMQALLRTKRARDELDWVRKYNAAVVIQSTGRKMVQRLKYKRVRVCIKKIQKLVRRVQKKKRMEMDRINNAATRIQAKYRAILERRVMKKMLKGVYEMQSRWRMKIAKLQMNRLKKEAKEVGALL